MSITRKRENTINFSPGPAALPDEVNYIRVRNAYFCRRVLFPLSVCLFQVVREAQENVMNYEGLGMGVMGE